MSESALTPCALWAQARDDDGYGITWRNGRKDRAHRVAWEDAHEQMIPEGLIVRHRCDNPPCVNPDHLLLGTHADNARDRRERGREPDQRGERNHRAKLTWEQVTDLRARVSEGASQRSEARRLGVHHSVVQQIIGGTLWPT